MKNNLLSICLLSLVLLTSACNYRTKSLDPARAQIDKVRIADYGKALFTIDPMNVKHGLDSLSEQFSFFIGENTDTLKVMQIRDFIVDPFNKSLAEKCSEKYPDLSFLEEGLTEMFIEIKTENPEFRVPKVYTYISGLLYESPVTFIDSIMLIGLDMFLGWDFEQYRAAGLPVYMTRRMEQQNIIPECARQVAISMIPGDFQPKTLLDHMIMHGKVLYALDVFLPETTDSLKIGYTASQVGWCMKNEASVWSLMIEDELLYKSDAFLTNRFIQDGPFTSGLPEGAPAMLGRYIGWKIVGSYMKKHQDTSISDLFKIFDSQQILSQSGYKPKK
jgi:hypothetical protein